MPTFVAGSIALGMLFSFGSYANAATANTATKAAGTGAHLSSPGLPASPPSGYRVETSAPVTAASGTQTPGSVTCPNNEQPASGGALVQSDSLDTAINSTYPSGQSWDVYVDNTSGASTTFTVWAVCLAHNAKYKVETSSYTADAQSLTLGEAFCPSGLVVTGGGVFAESGSLSENVAVSDPIVEGKLGYWHVYFNNDDPVSSTFDVYAVCHPKPKDYSFQQGADVTDPPGAQVEAGVTCPGTSVPLGGGGGEQIQGSDSAVTQNSSWPITRGWGIFENNGQGVSYDVDDQAVCAGS